MQHRLAQPENAQWHNPILADISFIRTHMRYPLNKRTLWPALTMGAMILLLLVVAVLGVIVLRAGLGRNIFPFAALFTGISIFVFRLFRSFYFISVSTGAYTTENIKLLRLFLAEQQLLVFHHPDAPEVFQIISRPLDGLKGRREVLVFIADDRRILINSHFTSDTGEAVQPLGAAHHRAMAAAFKKWIAAQTDLHPSPYVTIE